MVVRNKLGTLTLTQLQRLCKDLGLRQNGKRLSLINRIRAHYRTQPNDDECEDEQEEGNDGEIEFPSNTQVDDLLFGVDETESYSEASLDDFNGESFQVEYPTSHEEEETTTEESQQNTNSSDSFDNIFNRIMSRHSGNIDFFGEKQQQQQQQQHPTTNRSFTSSQQNMEESEEDLDDSIQFNDNPDDVYVLDDEIEICGSGFTFCDLDKSFDSNGRSSLESQAKSTMETKPITKFPSTTQSQNSRLSDTFSSNQTQVKHPFGTKTSQTTTTTSQLDNQLNTTRFSSTTQSQNPRLSSSSSQSQSQFKQSETKVPSNIAQQEKQPASSKFFVEIKTPQSTTITQLGRQQPLSTKFATNTTQPQNSYMSDALPSSLQTQTTKPQQTTNTITTQSERQPITSRFSQANLNQIKQPEPKTSSTITQPQEQPKFSFDIRAPQTTTATSQLDKPIASRYALQNQSKQPVESKAPSITTTSQVGKQSASSQFFIEIKTPQTTTISQLDKPIASRYALQNQNKQAFETKPSQTTNTTTTTQPGRPPFASKFSTVNPPKQPVENKAPSTTQSETQPITSKYIVRNQVKQTTEAQPFSNTFSFEMNQPQATTTTTATSQLDKPIASRYALQNQNKQPVENRASSTITQPDKQPFSSKFSFPTQTTSTTVVQPEKQNSFSTSFSTLQSQAKQLAETKFTQATTQYTTATQSERQPLTSRFSQATNLDKQHVTNKFTTQWQVKDSVEVKVPTTTTTTQLNQTKQPVTSKFPTRTQTNKSFEVKVPNETLQSERQPFSSKFSFETRFPQTTTTFPQTISTTTTTTTTQPESSRFSQKPSIIDKLFSSQSQMKDSVEIRMLQNPTQFQERRLPSRAGFQNAPVENVPPFVIITSTVEPEDDTQKAAPKKDLRVIDILQQRKRRASLLKTKIHSKSVLRSSQKIHDRLNGANRPTPRLRNTPTSANKARVLAEAKERHSAKKGSASKSPSKPIAARKKPDFDKIHEQEFSKMPSISDHQQNKRIDLLALLRDDTPAITEKPAKTSTKKVTFNDAKTKSRYINSPTRIKKLVIQTPSQQIRKSILSSSGKKKNETPSSTSKKSRSSTPVTAIHLKLPRRFDATPVKGKDDKRDSKSLDENSEPNLVLSPKQQSKPKQKEVLKSSARILIDQKIKQKQTVKSTK